MIINIDDQLEKIGSFGKFQIYMLILCGLGYFAICGEILVFVFIAKSIMIEMNLSMITYSWLPFTSTLCYFFGSFIFGIIADVYGRQYPFKITLCIASITGLLSAFSYSFILLLILRGCTSFAIGGLTSVDFVLFLECTPTSGKRHIVIIVMFGAIGVFLLSALAWGIMEKLSWHHLLGFTSCPLFIVSALRCLIGMESPRFLISQGKINEALIVLEKIAKINGYHDYFQKHYKIENIEHILVHNNEHDMNRSNKPLRLTEKVLIWRTNVRILFSNTFYRTITLFFGIIWFFQYTGYWGITIYLHEYLQRVIPKINSYKIIFLMIAAELPGLFLVHLFMRQKNIGPNNSLTIFLFGSFLSVSMLLLYEIFANDIGTWFFILFSMLSYFFIIPIFAILYTFTPDSYPTNIRTTAIGCMNCISCIPGLITPFTSSYLLSCNIKGIYTIVWATCFLIGTFMAFLLNHNIKKNSKKDDEYLLENSIKSENI